MDSTTVTYSAMEDFLKDSNIHYAPRNSSDYPALYGVYVPSSAHPIGIARPQTVEEVEALVRHCIDADIPFTVRSGGHDLFSRTHVQDCLTIDLRDINYVNISPDKKTAQIGGGILFIKLLRDLEKDGLHAATGTVGTVGWIGWATLGGYGWSTSFAGLGVDQILGARIINAGGKLVDADSQTLKGIRGGGGNFGVIVEATIKVYPLEEAQAGNIMYAAEDMESTVAKFFANFNALTQTEKMPPNLNLQPTVYGVPGVGRVFFCGFYWRGPRTSDCERWIARVASLADAAPDVEAMVKTTSTAQFMQEVTDFVPKKMFGKMQTVSVSHLSPDVIAVLAKHAAKVPLVGDGIAIHSLREGSPSSGPLEAFEDSVFASRDPHYLFEFIAGGNNEEEGELGTKWAEAVRNDMVKVDAVLDTTYPALTAPEHASVEKLFGAKGEELKRLKKELDPKGVFKYAIPRM